MGKIKLGRNMLLTMALMFFISSPLLADSLNVEAGNLEGPGQVEEVGIEGKEEKKVEIPLDQMNRFLERENEILRERLAERDREIKELEREIGRLNKIADQGEAEEISSLLYHHILAQADKDLYGWNGNHSVISLENFKGQIDYLYKNDYYTANLRELELFLRGEYKLPKKTVVITFDDGYLSNTELAYDLLRERNFVATLFTIGDSIEREKEDFDPSISQRIYIPEIGNYRDVFDFQCHTYNMHDIVDGLPKLLTYSDEDIRKDLLKNKEIFKPMAIAYPFGRYDERSLSIIKDLDYRLGFTVKPGKISRETDAFKIPRYVILPDTSMERFKSLVN